MTEYKVLVVHTENPVHSDEWTRKIVQASSPKEAVALVLATLRPWDPIAKVVVSQA